jgi:hypothetical protein
MKLNLVFTVTYRKIAYRTRGAVARNYGGGIARKSPERRHGCICIISGKYERFNLSDRRRRGWSIWQEIICPKIIEKKSSPDESTDS